MFIQIAVALLLVVANGFFVATEFGIARMRPTQVSAFEAAGRPGARSLRHAVDHLDAYLAACQLGITISSIGLGFVGKPAFEELIDPLARLLGDATGIAAYGLSFAFAFAFSLVTLLHVVFGELAPKSLAISRNTKTALAVAPPMRLFYYAMKPLVDVFNWMGNLVLRPFGIPPASEAGSAPHSESELRELLRHSVQEGGAARCLRPRVRGERVRVRRPACASDHGPARRGRVRDDPAHAPRGSRLRDENGSHAPAALRAEIRTRFAARRRQRQGSPASGARRAGSRSSLATSRTSSMRGRPTSSLSSEAARSWSAAPRRSTSWPSGSA